jgi:F-type H+-transporting ATPase subunit b
MKTIGIALILAAGTLVAQEHGEAKGEHGGGHEQPSLAWKWANFAILAGAIGYGISKAAGPFFRGRTEQIQRDLVEAKKIREEAEARAADIDRRMASLSTQIESLRADAKQEMSAENERMKSETARQLAKIEQHAQQEIESAVKHAQKDLRAHAAELALDLAARKIGSRMTPGAQEALVDSFASRLARPGTPN